jgi:hypothetical protein
MFAMNVIGRFKEKRREASRLSDVPKSSILGFSALPVELWSLVIEHVVLQHLEEKRLQCRELPDILKSRLVCRQCTSFT